MDDVKENRLSMYLKVQTHLTGNLSSYNAITGFTMGVWPEFITNIDNIFTKNAIADLDLTGYAEAKADKRAQLIAAMTTIYNGLAAYGAVNEIKPLLRKVDFSASEINKMRDSELYTNAKILQSIPDEIDNEAGLVPFQVNNTTKTALQTQSDQYLVLIQQPQDQAGQRSQAIIEIDAIFQKMDILLKDKLDFIAAVLAGINPTVYGLYQQARVIDDTGASTPPTYIGEVNPGEIVQIASLVYNANRSFRMKNEGTDSLKFGLSDDGLTIILPGVTVTGGNQSTRLSSTLAPTGGHLLVENIGVVAGSFKVWVEEG